MKNRLVICILVSHIAVIQPFTPQKTLTFAATSVLVGLSFVWWKRICNSKSISKASCLDSFQSNQDANVSRFVEYGKVLALSAAGTTIVSMLQQRSSYARHVLHQTHHAYQKLFPGQLQQSYIGDFSDIEQRELDMFCHQSLNTQVVSSGSGMLLKGPPGSGKTTFVREFARRSESILFEVNTSLLNTGYAGDGAAIVAELFAQAEQECKKGNRVILFFDELDLIGSRTTEVSSAAAQSQKATLGALLIHMNRIPLHMMVVGATNRVEDIDTALKRSGRIDTILTKELPTLGERHRLIKELQKYYLCLQEIDTDELAKDTSECSYGDLHSLCIKLVKIHDIYGSFSNEFVDECIAELQEKKEAESLLSFAEQRQEREKEQLDLSHQSLWWSKFYAGLMGASIIAGVLGETSDGDSTFIESDKD